MFPRDGGEMMADLESGAVFAARKLLVVDRGEVHEHVERQRPVVPAVRQYAQQGVTRDDRRQIPSMVVRLDDSAAEPPPELVENPHPPRTSAPARRPCPAAS